MRTPTIKATERIELSTPGLRDLCSATELSGSLACMGASLCWESACKMCRMDDEGFEPSTFRMQNGRSTTELNAPCLPG